MNIPEEFMRYNEDRHAAALEMRQRIAVIRAARAPAELTGKEVLRILTPDIRAEPPLTPRSVQRHLRALRLAEFRRQAQQADATRAEESSRIEPL